MASFGDQAGSQIRPHPRLIRDGRLLSKAFLILLILTLLMDGAEVGLMALRVGSLAGMLHGGFAFMVNAPWESDRSIPAAFVPISHYPLWKSSLATLLLSLRLMPALLILWSLFRLFSMYGRAEVFTARNELYVKRIAWSLLGYAAVPLLTHATLYCLGMSEVALKLEERQFDAAVAALILLALARVVSFGCEIEQDREGFV